jgi:hypothetical protein
MNTAGSRPSVDIYVVQSGELIDEASPFVPGYPLGFAPVQLPILPGTYDIYVTDAGEKVVLSGPNTLDLDYGDVVETIIFENVDPTVVDFAIIPPP